MIGIDTSDSTELDPVRDLHYTPPMTISACYDCLVTMTPGDYVNLKPSAGDAMGAHAGRQRLAVHVARQRQVRQRQSDDGRRREVLARSRAFHPYQASQYLTNVDSVNVVDDKTVDIMLKNPERADAQHPGGTELLGHRPQGGGGARRRR